MDINQWHSHRIVVIKEEWTSMEKRIITVILGLLVTLLGWLGSVNYAKLMEIEHSLAELKIEVARLQMSIITEEKVKEIAKGVLEHELLQRGLK